MTSNECKSKLTVPTLSIWKYPIPTSDGTILEMPDGAVVLTVQVQDGTPCLWALVDPAAMMLPRTFRCYGTGHPVAVVRHEYVGTYQERGGALVFHLFEVLP